ncbi:protein terminal ear1 [Andrographis paniculata]|uniref:protein terminal ear1 n=1 Tax=Andrographis paniculata TaxID=175694 RepID=UPI0021E8E673|nr:protein terminal ear1 [Andrographis paniculata]
MCAYLSKPLLSPNAPEYWPLYPQLHPAAAAPPQIGFPLESYPFYYPPGFDTYGGACSPHELLTYHPPPNDGVVPCPATHFCWTVRVPMTVHEPKISWTGGDDKIDRLKKGRKKILPPRLRRAERTFPAARKQEWRPRKTDNFKDSGGGDANSPPPPTADENSCSSKTTVMLRNIPNRLRRDFMLQFLDYHCKAHTLEYDFLYLPMDFRKEGNLGYAFVNFTSAADALRFKKVLDNYKWQKVYTSNGPIISSKVCEVTWARIQGKEALVRRFENSNFYCDNTEFLPVLLDPPRNGLDSDPAPPVAIGNLCTV